MSGAVLPKTDCVKSLELKSAYLNLTDAGRTEQDPVNQEGS